MKLMYAVWGTGLEAALHAPELRAALRAAGATRLQVNLDDADVASAKLRITTFEAPVTAVLSVWTDGGTAGTSEAAAAAGTSEAVAAAGTSEAVAAAGISKAVAGLGERCAGWKVQERTPLTPPRTEDGQRCPALAQLGFLRIPAGLDEAEWLHLWQGLHTSVALATQATFGYVQNRVFGPVLGDERIDALVEELFPMAAMTDVHAFYGSGGDEAELSRRLHLMIESVTRFGADSNLDVVPTSRYSYDL